MMASDVLRNPPEQRPALAGAVAIGHLPDLSEYSICQRRGHRPNGGWSNSLESWMTCAFCGVDYRFTEPELIERNAPESGDGAGAEAAEYPSLVDEPQK